MRFTGKSLVFVPALVVIAVGVALIGSNVFIRFVQGLQHGCVQPKINYNLFFLIGDWIMYAFIVSVLFFVGFIFRLSGRSVLLAVSLVIVFSETYHIMSVARNISLTKHLGCWKLYESGSITSEGLIASTLHVLFLTVALAFVFLRKTRHNEK